MSFSMCFPELIISCHHFYSSVLDFQILKNNSVTMHSYRTEREQYRQVLDSASLVNILELGSIFFFFFFVTTAFHFEELNSQEFYTKY